MDKVKVTTEDKTESKGRVRRAYETLSRGLTQVAETVERSSTLKLTSGDVEDIDAPDDIDKLHELYRDIGIIRANLNQFASDVVKPGVKVVAEDDTTEAYFNGGEDAPDFAPNGGFLSEAAIHGGEKRQHFEPFLRTTVLNRWTRGTVLVEYLKPEESVDDAESKIIGFKHIPPETVSGRVYDNTNILINPEDTDEVADEDITKRGEAAAFVQFDEQSIIGRRRGGDDRTSVPLSQNDVLKQALNPDIGGDDENEHGIFGTSILRAVKDDAEEYRSIKRDRAEAIKRKAYGIWWIEFQEEVLETSEGPIHRTWTEESQEDTLTELKHLGPNDVIASDGPAELKKFEPDVPDLDDVLQHYVDDILAPLPAPKWTVGFETDINQFVVEGEDKRYQQIIDDERRYQEREWSKAFRKIAERHPELDASGVQVKIQPEDDESPVLSLSDDEMEKLRTYTQAVNDLYGNNAAGFVPEELLNELVLQMPEDANFAADTDSLSLDDVEPDEAFDTLRGAKNGE